MSRFCPANNKTCLPAAVTGIERCPPSADIVAYSLQIVLNGLLEIPLVKPPKERIFNTIHEISISRYISILVKKPPGKKVLVVGDIMVGIEYIASVPDQKVHFAHWDVPFQALIKNADGSLLSPDFDISQYNVYVCVEHEDYSPLNERTIVFDIVLLVWLQQNNL